MVLIDLTGKRFGRLAVLNRATNDHGRPARWNCLCDCGNKTTVVGTHLRRGESKSCGCLQKELVGIRARKHGLSHTTLYYVWQGMKRRCIDPNHKEFDSYGGRGISVCSEWADNYPAFHEWMMAHGYKRGLQIDRIDNNGNYCPGNCRIVTQHENALNRPMLTATINGITKTIPEWSAVTRIRKQTVYMRLHRGWPIELAVSTSLPKESPSFRVGRNWALP